MLTKNGDPDSFVHYRLNCAKQQESAGSRCSKGAFSLVYLKSRGFLSLKSRIAEPMKAPVNVVGLAMAQNVSELVEQNANVFSQTEETLFALAEKADAAPTVLPPSGIAAAIGPNQSHIYSIDLLKAKINITLSLCECFRSPLSEKPLTLTSGTYQNTTQDGGLLQVFNLTTLNNTLVVTSPRTTNAHAYWSYQLGYDNTAAYTNDQQGLFWVDSDFANSLFITAAYQNFSQLLKNTPFTHFMNFTNINATTRDFKLFLHNVNSTQNPALVKSGNQTDEDQSESFNVYSGLRKSFCAMQDTGILNQNNADFSTTNRSSNTCESLYRGQFLFTGLNRSTYYEIQLAIPPPAGSLGGMVFAPVPFHTKESTSCQLIYNMTSCPNTAFSVPGNASQFTMNQLARLYDSYIEQYLNNFTQALSQVNCDAKPEDRFSLFSTCQDCKKAYQDWLCTVAVPRCEDWTNPAPYLRERNPGESRNEMINEVLRPGKYKEILPCYWLCNNLATYCPVTMGFRCSSGRLLNDSYGWPSDNGDMSCSFPGAIYHSDKASWLRPSWMLLISMLLFII